MNPDSPKTPQEEMEARLIALLLGELPEAEAAAWRAAIATNPELAKLHDRLKQTISLVREATAKVTEPAAEQAAPLKLSEERREKLLAHFKTVKPKEFAPVKRRVASWLVPMAATAVLVLLLAAIAIPNFTRARSSSQASAVINNLRQLDAAKQQWALERGKSATDTPTFDELKGYMKGELPPAVTGESYVLGKVGEPVLAEVDASVAKRRLSHLPVAQTRQNAGESRVRLSADNDTAYAAEEAAKTTLGFRTWGSERAGAAPAESRGNALFDVAVPLASKPISTHEKREPTAHYANAPTSKPVQDAPGAPPPPQIVLPSVVESESLGAIGIVKIADGQDSPPDNSSLAVRERRVDEGNKAVTTGVADEEQRRIFVERYGIPAQKDKGISPTAPPPSDPGMADSRVQVSGLKDHLYSDLNRTPPATPSPTAGAAIAMNGVDRPAFAGRGVSPETGLPVPADHLTSDGAALDQTLTVTWAESAFDFDHGLETANRKSGAIGAGTGGGGGGAGERRLYRIAPDGTVAGDFVAGYAVTPESDVGRLSPAIQPPPVPATKVAATAPAATEAPSQSAPPKAELRSALHDFAAIPTVPGGLESSRLETQPGPESAGGAPASWSAAQSAALNGPAQTGADATKLPVLGDVPALGLLYQNEGSGRFEKFPSDSLAAFTPESAPLKDEESLRRQPSIILPSVEQAGEDRAKSTERGRKAEEGRALVEAGKPADAAGSTFGAAWVDYDSDLHLDLHVRTNLLDFKRSGVEVNSIALPSPELAQKGNTKSRERLVEREPEVRAAQKEVGELHDQLLNLDAAGAVLAPGASLAMKEVVKEQARRVRELERVSKESKADSTESTNLNQALSRYAELTGKTLLRPSSLPPAKVQLKKQASLSKAEEIRALDENLALNGISMVNVGDELVKALPMAMANSAGSPLAQSLAAAADLSDQPFRKPSTNAPIPQPEIQASENAFSTFSLNVSDVSFKLAAASLEKGQMPDPASIRSEEFINAFDYRDPEPPPGMPVAFAWERAHYPFAHNRDLLRFSLKAGAVGRQAGRALNLVLLLDNSGSMERADRVHIIREALRVLAGQLQPQDKISVITFARTPRLWVDGAPGSDAGAVAMAASELTPQGGTNLEEAMNLAYQTALRHYVAGGINRVVVLTDGAANLGNVEPESLKQKVETHRKQGIALDCFGIGWEGFNDDLLEVLSRNGDGRYGFINSPEEAATEFAGQLAGALQVAASDVKVQVEFNPARVTAYRQIGYAKHQLTKEQFRDNTVDAAEIAAQEAGNAIYTVEVNPAGEGPLCIVRVRFKFPGTVVYREHEWAVPYNGSAVSLEQSSPAMRLAASASAFSEWLVASPFAAEVTPDALLGYLSGVPEIYGADARPKKLEWMIRQAKSIEGK
jgi:Mg-chelatase subunit ChlD/anti-sigma factor RsiW